MKSKFEKLLSAKLRGNAKDSVNELLTKPMTYTGRSGYSKGWSNKSIWTGDVCHVLEFYKIKHESGNNAPRGGANGEFVKITDKAFLKAQKLYKESLMFASAISDCKQDDEFRAKLKAANDFIASLSENEQFENKWNSTELKQASGLSWSSYRDKLKTDNPEEWKILKAKFQAKQFTSVY